MNASLQSLRQTRHGASALKAYADQMAHFAAADKAQAG
jgi:hypothetical protein